MTRRSQLSSAFGKLLAFLGPGLFLIAYNVGTGTVTTMASAGSRWGVSLGWTVLLSCLFTYVGVVLATKYTLVTGETLLFAIRRHLPWGRAIALGIDAFQTGTARAPRDTDRRAFINFNQTNDACRLQDILTAIEYARKRSQASTVNLVGLEMAGVWSYFARAMADQHVNLVADLAQFRAETDSEYVSRFFIPGLRKAGDFRAAATLNARGKVLLHNASSEFPAEWAKNCARLAGSTLDIRTSPASQSEILAWLAQDGSTGSGS